MHIVAPEEVGLSSAGLARIDAHLQRTYLDSRKIAGALTLVARRGKVAFLSPLGSMDRERNKPMRVDTIFRIYSMTKPVTSVALMQLHERGLFSLSDPVHQWIPEFRDLRVFKQGRYPNFLTEPTLRPMTVRDLLTHQSGLTYGFMERTAVDAAYRKLEIDRFQGTLREFVQTLAQLPLEFSPGARWNYSVATDVIGHLVELISGQRYDEYLQTHIFAPLGMVDTSFHVPEAKRERFAASYRRGEDGELALVDDPAKSPWCRTPTFFSGGGGLVSTIGDYHRFTEMLRRGGELDGQRIIGPRTLGYMATNHLPNNQDLAACALGSFSEARYEGSGFGLGFSVVIDPVRAQIPTSVGEFAWGGMASTAFWVDPREDLTVVFMTQLLPSSTYNFRGQLKSIVYGAIAE